MKNLSQFCIKARNDWIVCGEVSANYPHLNGNISMTTANWDSLSLSLSHVTTVTVTRTDRNIISIIYTTSGLKQAQTSPAFEL